MIIYDRIEYQCRAIIFTVSSDDVPPNRSDYSLSQWIESAGVRYIVNVFIFSSFPKTKHFAFKAGITSIIAGGLINLSRRLKNRRNKHEKTDESLLKAHSDYLSSETDFSFLTSRSATLKTPRRNDTQDPREIMRRTFIIGPDYKLFNKMLFFLLEISEFLFLFVLKASEIERKIFNETAAAPTSCTADNPTETNKI